MSWLRTAGVEDVALRKESVDRNLGSRVPVKNQSQSLSARRAWIEIAMTSQISVSTVSLSARRAWIEIVAWLDYSQELLVALRKESVDRNAQAPSA